MRTKLTLGTRKSLLAWSQSQWVARSLERLNPGIEIELYGIETRGDRILDVPLQKIGGKEFFVAEIDDALLSGKVDFTVHSLKDLSLDRPKAFTLGAIPRRENPRDVVLFGPSALSRLKAGEEIQIGTSSPRRLKNIPDFLEQALPRQNPHAVPRLNFVEIRGNVNTRLSRVHEAPTSPKYLDAVVLAFAGLIRLGLNPQGQQELKKLLSGVRWMVLPLKECPAAPGQGALAVECRSNDLEMKELLKSLHHDPTAWAVQKERQLLAEWGGGCHQKFGATSIQASPGLGQLFYIRGDRPDGVFMNEVRWNVPSLQGVDPRSIQPWDGSQWREKSVSEGLNHSSQTTQATGVVRISDGQPVFVAHSRAIEVGLEGDARIWTSGKASWFRLAQKGYWVEGCAEGLGFDELIPTLSEPVLQLDDWKNWTVLTHSDATTEWQKRGISAVPTYQIQMDYGEEAISALRKASHIFWSSGSQFHRLSQEASAQAQHACGPGATAARLMQSGVQPQLFPSVEEWRKWLKI